MSEQHERFTNSWKPLRIRQDVGNVKNLKKPLELFENPRKNWTSFIILHKHLGIVPNAQNLRRLSETCSNFEITLKKFSKNKKKHQNLYGKNPLETWRNLQAPVKTFGNHWNQKDAVGNLCKPFKTLLNAQILKNSENPWGHLAITGNLFLEPVGTFKHLLYTRQKIKCNIFFKKKVFWKFWDTHSKFYKSLINHWKTFFHLLNSPARLSKNGNMFKVRVKRSLIVPWL